jgi:TonB family protein
MKVRYTNFTPSRATLKVIEVAEATSDNPDASSIAKPVEVGQLNAKAVDLPKAVYSEEAKRLKASGKINVKVIVDENGKVVSALALNGQKVLRDAAEEAARKAVFKPMTQDGITVRVTGVLTYEFP